MSNKIIAILVFLLTIAMGCSSQSAEGPSLQKTPEDAQQKLSNFTLAGYEQQGKKKWEVQGDSADIKSNIIELDKITAKTYDEQSDIIVTADKGSVNTSSGEIKLKENVVATTSDGSKMTTDYLDWKAKEEKVTTDAVVFVENETMKTTAKGAVAEPTLKKVKLSEDVVMNVMPATTITCDGPLEFDYANNVAVLNNNVKVVDDKGEVYADKVIAYFTQGSRELDKVIAKGNVRIVKDGDTTYSEEAVYLVKEKRVILKGQPQLVIHPSGEIGF